MNEESNDNSVMGDVLGLAAIGLAAFGGYKGYKHLTKGAANAESKTAKKIAEKVKEVETPVIDKIETKPKVEKPKETKPKGEKPKETKPIIERPTVGEDSRTTQDIINEKAAEAARKVEQAQDAQILLDREEFYKNAKGEYREGSKERKHEIMNNRNAPMTSSEVEDYHKSFFSILDDVSKFAEEVDPEMYKNFYDKHSMAFLDAKDSFKSKHNVLFDMVDTFHGQEEFIGKQSPDLLSKYNDLQKKIDTNLDSLGIKRVNAEKGKVIKTDIDKRDLANTHESILTSDYDGKSPLDIVGETHPAYTKDGQKIKDGKVVLTPKQEKFTPEEKQMSFADNFTPSESIQNTADVLTEANNVDPLKVENRDKGLISYLYGDGEKNAPKIFVNDNIEELLKTKQVEDMFNNFVGKGLNPEVASKLDPTNPMDMLPILTAHEVGHHYDITSRLKNGTIEEFAKNQNIARDIQEKAAAAAKAGDTKAFEEYTHMYRDAPNEAYADNFAIEQMNEHYKKMWPEKNWDAPKEKVKATMEDFESKAKEIKGLKFNKEPQDLTKEDLTDMLKHVIERRDSAKIAGPQVSQVQYDIEMQTKENNIQAIKDLIKMKREM